MSYLQAIVWVYNTNIIPRISLTGNADLKDFPGAAADKNPPADTGDTGSIPGSGRSPREGNGNPLQDSCLANPMNRRAWWAMVHGVAKNWTQLQ